MLGLFDTANFDGHLKTLENLYHEFVLTRGDFDERIFLNNQADQQIGTPVKGIIGLYFDLSWKFIKIREKLQESYYSLYFK